MSIVVNFMKLLFAFKIACFVALILHYRLMSSKIELFIGKNFVRTFVFSSKDLDVLDYEIRIELNFWRESSYKNYLFESINKKSTDNRLLVYYVLEF